MHLVIGQCFLQFQLFSRLNGLSVKGLNHANRLDNTENALALFFTAITQVAPPSAEFLSLLEGQPKVNWDNTGRHQTDVEVGIVHQPQCHNGTAKKWQNIDKKDLYQTGQ